MADKPNPIQVQKFLGGMDYPASKQDVLQCAEQNGAGKDVLESLKKIPDRQYDGPNAVSKEVAHA
ncbi:DUF2795 domain-containing protein [Actinocrispum sp. NPDC049592]|uniref:DUF2795 domain-containing protein n=1 Tax=Actinocrispum sp. NPDC049592 TaxID=3154835 RepID=UPI00342AD388